VFDIALETGCVSVPVEHNAPHIQELQRKLRTALCWLRDHGATYDVVIRLHHKVAGKYTALLVQRRRVEQGYTIAPQPIVINDAQGNTRWLHGPPPIPGDTQK
jgi:hypothetical protein